jgi:membrane-associated protein
MSLHSLLDPIFIIQAIGLIGVVAVIFAESGLFFGFFLPGDSLLFTAGLLASQGHINIALLITTCTIAAIVGDSVGYAFGKKVGPALFTKPKSWLFSPERILQAKLFYDKHGKKALIIARFIPAVRTFAPIVAGIGGMNYRSFLMYNVVGGVLWVVSMSVLGFVLGATVPNIDTYILPIVILIVIISILPSVIQMRKGKRI